jgi:GTP-binding protein LepA
MHTRNFSIIAHIDHGKSTLADRMLEVTHTIETRKMKDQVLDRMDLEREKGITIKMQPVRMAYTYKGETYQLNLIDTPGHIDFSYEVSRALHAVEGSILLVDATQGVQAQTLTTLRMAREQGLVIIPAISKIDSPLARIEETREEIMKTLGVSADDVLLVSGRTGENVSALLDAVIERIPPPTLTYAESDGTRALIFDFSYSNHRGVIVYVRMLDGSIKKGDKLSFIAAKEQFFALEVGHFSPEEIPDDALHGGEIGYIVTGIKRPGIAGVGDTITSTGKPLPALAGYRRPTPVVWASIFPESQDDFHLLKQALERLQLSDSAISFEEESSGILGRGFRCGCLGMLHLEILTERLKREFQLALVITTPTITYIITDQKTGKKTIIYSPPLFPDDQKHLTIEEPWIDAEIITPPEYLGGITQLLFEHEGTTTHTDVFGDRRTAVRFEMPLRELMRGFFDKLKSVSSGFASLSYEESGHRLADVVRLDILVADEPVQAFTKVVSRRRAEEEAQKTVEKLFTILPRQLFVMKIQGRAMGRIIASRTVSALRKDVTGYLYGGDITRKMKLLEKQKKGKKKMKERGSPGFTIPQDVFLKMIKSD